MLEFYLMSLNSDDDRRLFEYLYNEYKNKLYYIAYKMLGNEASAEDAVHDTYMKVINHIEKFYDISEEHIRNLIILILKNRVRDMLRQNRAEPVPFDEEEYQAKYNLVSDDSYNADKDEMKECLKLLEIADILNIGSKAVNSRIFRAKRMLSEIIAEREEEIP